MKKLNEKELKSVNGGASKNKKNKTSKPASASQNVYSPKPPKKVVPKKIIKPSKTVVDKAGNKRQTK